MRVFNPTSMSCLVFDTSFVIDNEQINLIVMHALSRKFNNFYPVSSWMTT